VTRAEDLRPGSQVQSIISLFGQIDLQQQWWLFRPSVGSFSC